MNHTVEYLINSGSWSSVGFVAGYLLARIRQDVKRAEEEIRKLRSERDDT